MIKIEFDVLKIDDFKYGDNKDKPACTMWLSNGEPLPVKFTVFGNDMVNKAHAYAAGKKAFLTVGTDNQLNARLQLL